MRVLSQVRELIQEETDSKSHKSNADTKQLKVMLIPNNVQKTKMFQYAGASRFAYNWALAREKENYEKVLI
ncbi:helix-turn-helix domain-containing protein [Dorea sp.]|uniref:helix-turn-helix domain-containing protein n=1 Tax=Dorea sp. TaxID=2040332 RepID=UPI002FE6EB20